ncbi:DNA-binding protein [Ramlibacter sp. XY19]|uniref:DNA-binding protein n=1 Tax=Ramlibacter paludis TaxID=2908000 RepID=UPI0023DB6AED|nr:DNA-binding protein [Ramlibacter paludis]MCG2592979.1 DNA-binding protein [Ramlibacter paludis]
MTRPGQLTFEEVKGAYENLEAAGKPISTRKVHEELAFRGSRTTLCEHYRAVERTRKAAEPGDTPPLSALVLRELARDIERVVQERTSQLSAELADLGASLDVVVAENEAFRAAKAEAESRVAALQVSAVEQSGITEALRSQNESLAKQLDAVHSEAKSARQALAIARDQLRELEERAGRLEALGERTRNEVADALRVEAELRQQLEAKTHECIALHSRADAGRQIEGRLEHAAAKVEKLHTELEETRGRLAASEAQRIGLAERLKDAQDARTRAEVTGQQLLRKVLDNTPGLQATDAK